MIKSLDGIISKDKLTEQELATLLASPDLEITEKIDGSQITWIKSHIKGLIISSKKLILYPDGEIPNLFKSAVDYLISIEKSIPYDIQFYAETLTKPRHNVLKYERVPKNHLYLFAAKAGEDYATLDQLMVYASRMEIEGPHVIQSINDSSCLGGTMEGIVYSLIKKDGSIHKCKEVAQEFKEVKQQLKDRKRAMKGCKTDHWEEFKQRFKTEARWQKAIQHLEEQAALSHQDSDIGLLFKEVMEDIIKEEQQTMVDYFNKTFRKELLKESCNGLVEFYRNYLKNSSPAAIEVAKENLKKMEEQTDEDFLTRAETNRKLEGIF